MKRRWIALLLAVFTVCPLALSCSSSLVTEETTGKETFTMEETHEKTDSQEEEAKTVKENEKTPKPVEDPKADTEFNVFCMGNSNCYYWMDELYGLLSAAGYKNVTVCNAYYSGGTFKQHWEWLRLGEANYEFIIHDSTGKKGSKNVDLKYCLKYKNWDAVLYVAGNSKVVYQGDREEYEKSLRNYLPSVHNYIKEQFPKTDYYWQQIWAQGIGGRPNSVEEQLAAEEIFRKVSIDLCADYGLTRVPQGEAWEKIGHHEMISEDGTKTLHTRIFKGKSNYDDHIHDGDVGGGQYLNACVFFEILTGKSCLANTFRPKYTFEGKDLSLTEEKIAILKKAAHQAVADVYGEDFAK